MDSKSFLGARKVCFRPGFDARGVRARRKARRAAAFGAWHSGRPRAGVKIAAGSGTVGLSGLLRRRCQSACAAAGGSIAQFQIPCRDGRGPGRAVGCRLRPRPPAPRSAPAFAARIPRRSNDPAASRSAAKAKPRSARPDQERPPQERPDTEEAASERRSASFRSSTATVRAAGCGSGTIMVP
jgi:hypothetical protein